MNICEYCKTNYMSDLLDDLVKMLIDEDERYCSIECEEKANFLAAKRYRLSQKSKEDIISLGDFKQHKKGNFSKKFLEESLIEEKTKICYV